MQKPRCWPTDDLDADWISLLAITTAVVKVTPCIPTPGALGKWFPGFASADGHGVHVIIKIFVNDGFTFAAKAEYLADSRRPIVAVLEAMAADRVGSISIPHLRDKFPVIVNPRVASDPN